MLSPRRAEVDAAIPDIAARPRRPSRRRLWPPRLPISADGARLTPAGRESHHLSEGDAASRKAVCEQVARLDNVRVTDTLPTESPACVPGLISPTAPTGSPSRRHGRAHHGVREASEPCTSGSPSSSSPPHAVGCATRKRSRASSLSSSTRGRGQRRPYAIGAPGFAFGSIPRRASDADAARHRRARLPGDMRSAPRSVAAATIISRSAGCRSAGRDPLARPRGGAADARQDALSAARPSTAHRALLRRSRET